MVASRCHFCGKYELMLFTCKYCGGRFCADHRLPENHHCLGIAEYKQKLRESGTLHENVQNYAGEAVQKGLGGASGWLRFASNNSALALLIIISFVFLLKPIPVISNIVYHALVFYPPSLFDRPWTIVTYMFLHWNFTHLLFNGMFLFFFGPELERRIGTPRFLFIFFASGIVAALGHMLTSSVPIIGASGALYGVLATLTILAPHIRIYVYFIPMPITYALILLVLLDFLMMGSGDAVAHIAHLSGLVVGLAAGYHLKSQHRIG
ncbi:MAG: uncharacterized protein AEth_00558 [Candidatus Argoarchaeum ethanivorans]|uniref:AN1-type domain-containing protein n=1 Tax=Candidatus Argoarchaeum ethanivorans TaxID=2608793 RepID=A0A8B3S683_9EURY|nr:MAG: uncharacterized protein AEth_00558 [Candidatus Argoarchaeum ethanivorans]